MEVHAEIGSEKREREENDGDASEDEDGVILGVGDDGQLVLLDGFELEKLSFEKCQLTMGGGGILICGTFGVRSECINESNKKGKAGKS